MVEPFSMLSSLGVDFPKVQGKEVYVPLDLERIAAHQKDVRRNFGRVSLSCL